jgi:hypothetical protein
MIKHATEKWVKKIAQARKKEEIIQRWISGEKLVDLMKVSDIELRRKQWWVLKKKYQEKGFEILLDKRAGGRTPKITEEIKKWIGETKKITLSLGRKEIKKLVEERYSVEIGLRTISEVLKEEGIRQARGGQEKEKLYDKRKGIPVDCAGSWFLKGADSDMKGIATITEIILREREKYLGKKNEPWWRILKSNPETIIRKNESLLYLPVFGMQKPYHLDKYHKRGLGILTGSGRRYSYDTLEGHLINLDKLQISKQMSAGLAKCYLEALCIGIELKDGSYFYIDGHSKHVWSSKNIPKVFFTTLNRVEKGLQQYFLNSSKGHPLILLTCPGDSHLTKEMFNLIESFENAVGKEIVKVSIFDREGLSLALFNEFESRKNKKYFITLLRSNQYKGIEDFKIKKDFKPLKTEKKKTGEKKVIEWVAEAEKELKDRETKKKLTVRVALVKKPVKGREKLIAIITNLTEKEEPDIARIAKRYFDRWPNQENIFKDMIGAIKSNTNHGYTKKVVENRVVNRRKEELEENMRGIEKKINSATEETESIGKQLESMKKVYISQKEMLRKSKLDLHKNLTFVKGMGKRKEIIEDLKKIENKQLGLIEGYAKNINQLETKEKNKSGYLKSLLSQRDNKERELKSLNLDEVLLEMKTEKDHVMSNFKILLTNLSNYAQEQYFPQEKKFQNATFETMMKTFYRQDGYVNVKKTKVEVMLYSYDVPELQEAVEYACMKFNASNLRTLSGQMIWMGVES